MLSALFSNQNIERILLFLFVNQRGYGSQINSLLNVPLTPLQHALNRLEDGKVIHSIFEKNKRIYELNLNYPLLNELEALLKKAYALLPNDEKRKYCFVHKSKTSLKEDSKIKLIRENELKQFFKRLSKVKKLTLKTQTKKNNEIETREGKAFVLISSNNSNELIFHEKGTWNEGPISNTTFTNTFRWTLDIKASLITLEHLRYGLNEPIFLFHLTSNANKTLESIDPHLCNQDTYLANINWNKDQINFNWRVIGPKKNDILNYVYH